MSNCTLTGNLATNYGGGVSGSTNSDCTPTGNLARDGGGAAGGKLNNCTLTGNLATNSGGGAYQTTLNSCIVYFNTATAGTNYSDGTLNYCCTTPQPANGFGNIILDPQLASASHLSASCPCRGTGSVGYATGTDIDGEAWGTPPSIGCDEYRLGALTGPWSVSIFAPSTNAVMGRPLELIALIEGRTTASAWDFGWIDGDKPTLRYPCLGVARRLHNRVTRLQREHTSGVSAIVTMHVTDGIHYVSAGSTNPVSPFLSWATASTNI